MDFAGSYPFGCSLNDILFLLTYLDLILVLGLLKSGYFADNSFPYVKCLTASREMDDVVS
ncbi:hypothetical protein MUK42_33711 [Musa troglodytarum]|uniref:Uncharacterized protein n=1 Tax=Musa troglodytarum TaxID=320322 RepID=A0A9E7GIB3_9LILI|nr:hypothetical protein MUK42_33711 [Musa troglodytarum]